MKRGFDFSFRGQVDIDGNVVDLEIKVDGYRPERPAPPCSNPDSPRFSDCGDDAEWNDHKVFLVIPYTKITKTWNGKIGDWNIKKEAKEALLPIGDDDLLSTIDDKLIDLIIHEGEEISECRRAEEDERLYEQMREDKYMRE